VRGRGHRGRAAVLRVFSKDAILVAAYQHAPWMYWLGTVTAGMTAFYVFRAIFLAFFGEYRGDKHAHESPPAMLIPLAILASCRWPAVPCQSAGVSGAALPRARSARESRTGGHLRGSGRNRNRAGLADVRYQSRPWRNRSRPA